MPPKRNTSNETNEVLQELVSELRNNAAFQERLMERIQQIEEKVQRIEEKLDRNQQTPIVPVPVQRMKPGGLITKEKILESFRQYIEGKSEDDYKGYLAVLDEHALDALQ